MSRHNLSRDEWAMRAREFVKRGDDLPFARLTPDAVRQIRANAHGLSDQQWAQKLGVDRTTIRSARSYQTWVHVR